MSSGAEVSVLGPRRWAVSRETVRKRTERPLIRLATFAALALYGSFRWSALMNPAPTWRVLGMCGLAIAIAGAGALLQNRWLAVAIGIVAVIAMFPIAGIPFEWVRHVRLAVGARAIGSGLSALPNALVPYLGINHWVRVVIVLGAGVLLLDAALLAAFAPSSLGDVRRAGAALPLVALAIVPTTLVRPELPYVQGLILFGLLAAFMWAERAPTRDAATAIAVIAVAGLGSLIAAPRVDPHKPWIDYQALAAKLAPAHLDVFNWQQGYGPLHWPTKGREVLDVQAAHPDYWKAENLDAFEGQGWTTASVGGQIPPNAISASARKRWTQTIQVTIRSMKTLQVIAAGEASDPVDVAQGVQPGISTGTWMAEATLEPGDSYKVTTYSPHPSAAQLTAAGTDYPAGLIPGYLQFTVPGFYNPHVGRVGQQLAVIPPFGTTQAAAYGPTSTVASQFIRYSPYAQTYALATRLRKASATPYAYAEAIINYLHHGFTYDQDVPAANYPIPTFLFKTKRGYCQQFAGAMALLLRMGGVPARVAVGFTTGVYDSATHEYVVDDTDAHAWVEAWFPSYGWVRFDPTPSAAPTPAASSISQSHNGGFNGSRTITRHGLNATGVDPTKLTLQSGKSVPVWLAIVAVLALLAVVAFLLRFRRRREALQEEEELIDELERALRRTGRSVDTPVTLAVLEDRFGSSGAGGAYIRAIRLARYGGNSSAPTREQRRAFRSELAAGLGLSGRLRALWALPPRR